MKTTRLALTMSLVFALAGCAAPPAQQLNAQAAPEKPAETSAADTAAAPSDELVCRVEQKTGSRLGKTKVCRTRAQLEAMSKESRDAMRESDRKSYNQLDPKTGGG